MIVSFQQTQNPGRNLAGVSCAEKRIALDQAAARGLRAEAAE